MRCVIFGFGYMGKIRYQILRDRLDITDILIVDPASVRGSQFEVSVNARFLGEGAFLVQGLQAFPPKYFLRRIGVLTPAQLQSVEDALLQWLGARIH